MMQEVATLSQPATTTSGRMEFSRDGRDEVLKAEILLPKPIDEVFSFFSDAYNLEALTPPWLRFNVVTPKPIEMKPGTLIDYKLRVRGLPLRWQSEICVWEPPHRFVDQQLIGPYKKWYHEHTFEEIDGGTLVRDIVHFRAPGPRFLGAIFVKPDVRRIFRYRQEQLAQRFGD